MHCSAACGSLVVADTFGRLSHISSPKLWIGGPSVCITLDYRLRARSPETIQKALPTKWCLHFRVGQLWISKIDRAMISDAKINCKKLQPFQGFNNRYIPLWFQRFEISGPWQLDFPVIGFDSFRQTCGHERRACRIFNRHLSARLLDTNTHFFLLDLRLSKSLCRVTAQLANLDPLGPITLSRIS